jgi:hypothetical protein
MVTLSRNNQRLDQLRHDILQHGLRRALATIQRIIIDTSSMAVAVGTAALM